MQRHRPVEVWTALQGDRHRLSDGRPKKSGEVSGVRGPAESKRRGRTRAVAIQYDVGVLICRFLVL